MRREVHRCIERDHGGEGVGRTFGREQCLHPPHAGTHDDHAAMVNRQERRPLAHECRHAQLVVDLTGGAVREPPRRHTLTLEAGDHDAVAHGRAPEALMAPGLPIRAVQCNHERKPGAVGHLPEIRREGDTHRTHLTIPGAIRRVHDNDATGRRNLRLRALTDRADHSHGDEHEDEAAQTGEAGMTGDHGGRGRADDPAPVSDCRRP